MINRQFVLCMMLGVAVATLAGCSHDAVKATAAQPSPQSPSPSPMSVIASPPSSTTPTQSPSPAHPTPSPILTATPSMEPQTVLDWIAAKVATQLGKNLSGLAHLYTLEWIHTGLRDLEGMRNVKTLKFLNVSQNPLSDLSPLASLPQLEMLDIQQTDVKSIQPLLTMKSLKVLTVTRGATAKIRSQTNDSAKVAIATILFDDVEGILDIQLKKVNGEWRMDSGFESFE